MVDTQLFIVRIQRTPGAFLATARRVDEEVRGQFEQPQALLEFLLGAQPPQAPAAAARPQGDADERP
jgi:hypothetical protein